MSNQNKNNPNERTPQAAPQKPAPTKQAPAKQPGVGQSGYGSGRSDKSNDEAIDRKMATENVPYPSDRDAARTASDPATDDRFTGRGGRKQPQPPGDADAELDASKDVINDDNDDGPGRGAD